MLTREARTYLKTGERWTGGVAESPGRFRGPTPVCTGLEEEKEEEEGGVVLQNGQDQR